MADYMTFTNTFKVKAVERMNNSRNGNPKFKFIFYNGKEMVTPTDVMWAYKITPHAVEDTTIRVKYRTKGKHLEIMGIA